MVLSSAAQDFGVMRNDDGLMILVEQFSQRQHPRLKLWKANVIIWFINQNRLRCAGLQRGTHHVKTDEGLFAVRKLVKKQLARSLSIRLAESQSQRLRI